MYEFLIETFIGTQKIAMEKTLFTLYYPFHPLADRTAAYFT